MLPGNESQPATVLAPPPAPAATASSDNSATTITGTAQANTTINLYDSSSALIDTTTADSLGNFSFSLNLLTSVGQSYSLTSSNSQSTSTPTPLTVAHFCAPMTTDNLNSVGSSVTINSSSTGSATIGNTANLINSDLSDSALISHSLLSAGTATIKLNTSPQHIYPANSYIGVVTSGTLIVSTPLVLNTYLAGALQQTISQGTLSPGLIQFVTSASFDAVEVQFTLPPAFAGNIQLNYLCAG